MNRFLSLLWRRRKLIGGVLLLLMAGACVGWEERRVVDERTGQPISQHHGLIFAWKPCGVSGGETPGGSPVKFHVRQRIFYGLVQLEANGETY